MGRLIDADRLKEGFREDVINTMGTIDDSTVQLLMIGIDECPTAYDVDKVVGQLENKMFSAELHGDEWDGQTVSNLLCMGDIYEIVKGAVKNE